MQRHKRASAPASLRAERSPAWIRRPSARQSTCGPGTASPGLIFSGLLLLFEALGCLVSMLGAAAPLASCLSRSSRLCTSALLPLTVVCLPSGADSRQSLMAGIFVYLVLDNSRYLDSAVSSFQASLFSVNFIWFILTEVLSFILHFCLFTKNKIMWLKKMGALREKWTWG